MEDDLIRRGAVLKLIEDIKCDPKVPKNYGTLLDIMGAVREIPTAYDVDKVVERMKEEIKQAWELCDGGVRYSAYENALEIVKSGGID